ncbi:hypothetical protein C9374_014427 [Naegleria lovaniensis]|uniref:ORC1/DEAH AAA+ ATPase domain-containing protein n=1 Tax=Naegleria lovaniensis TaxID=51637 RepID=A0AA88GXT3_NAELO|nr:uncharacterized protein C9374_014427 [Naegleria lovaniensis]KAG2389027.1 hypothetical protein C9374_014427 [Naegleria lovaniensis]
MKRRLLQQRQPCCRFHHQRSPLLFKLSDRNVWSSSLVIWKDFYQQDFSSHTISRSSERSFSQTRWHEQLNNEDQNSSSSSSSITTSPKSSSELKDGKEVKEGKEGKKEDKKKATWSSYFKKWVTYGALTAIAITLINLQELRSEETSIQKIRQGSVNLKPSLDHDLISREREIQELKKYLPFLEQNSAELVNPSFVLVVGRMGTGKSLISELLAKEMGNNCIHIQFHKDMKETQIVEAIAKAINYHPFMNRNDLPFFNYVTTSMLEIIRPTKRTFSEMTKVLKDVTRKMSEAKEGMVPYIIFDNVDALYQPEGFNFLIDLLELAKEGSSKRWFGSVFFTNEVGLKMLKTSPSHYSITKTYYIPGIEKKDAMSYIAKHLKNVDNDPESIASILVDKVCGDNLKSIMDVIAKLKQNKSIEKIIDESVQETKYNFRGLELGQIDKNIEAFGVWNLLDYMHKNNGECTISEACICIGNFCSKPLDLIDDLITRGIISSTPSASLTFFNRSVFTLISKAKEKRPAVFNKFNTYQPMERVVDF